MKKGIKFMFAVMVSVSMGLVSCSEDDPIDNGETNDGIIGEWEAYDISPVLLGLGYDDSLYVSFNEDNTYEVKSYIGGAEYLLVGTYIQDQPEGSDIWEITLNQTSMNGAATDITSEGIFQVYEATPDSMYYEVAQTNPEISGVFPATVEGGFGSTSGGAWGNMNIQKYKRR